MAMFLAAPLVACVTGPTLTQRGRREFWKIFGYEDPTEGWTCERNECKLHLNEGLLRECLDEQGVAHLLSLDCGRHPRSMENILKKRAALKNFSDDFLFLCLTGKDRIKIERIYSHLLHFSHNNLLKILSSIPSDDEFQEKFYESALDYCFIASADCKSLRERLRQLELEVCDGVFREDSRQDSLKMLAISSANNAPDLNLQFEDYGIDPESENLDSYLRELTGMKSEKVGRTGFTFFDILTLLRAPFALCIGDERIISEIKSIELRRRFPIYAGYFQIKTQIAERDREIMARALNCQADEMPSDLLDVEVISILSGRNWSQFFDGCVGGRNSHESSLFGKVRDALVRFFSKLGDILRSIVVIGYEGVTLVLTNLGCLLRRLAIIIRSIVDFFSEQRDRTCLKLTKLKTMIDGLCEDLKRISQIIALLCE